MKKYVWMLAVVLTLGMVSTSCKDDKEEPVNENYSLTLPVLDFGASSTAIMNAEKHVYVRTIDDVMFFAANKNMAYPWYLYDFDNGKMDEAAVAIEFDDNADCLDTMENMLKNNGFYYLGETDDDSDEEVIYYGNNKDYNKATVYVGIGADEDYTMLIASFISAFDEDFDTADIAKSVRKMSTRTRSLK